MTGKIEMRVNCKMICIFLKVGSGGMRSYKRNKKQQQHYFRMLHLYFQGYDETLFWTNNRAKRRQRAWIQYKSYCFDRGEGQNNIAFFFLYFAVRWNISYHSKAATPLLKLPNVSKKRRWESLCMIKLSINLKVLVPTALCLRFPSFISRAAILPGGRGFNKFLFFFFVSPSW